MIDAALQAQIAAIGVDEGLELVAYIDLKNTTP